MRRDQVEMLHGTPFAELVVKLREGRGRRRQPFDRTNGRDAGRFRAMEPRTDAGDEQAVIDAFHRLYYDAQKRTWKQSYWMGRSVRKCPLDLWTYQELLTETTPDLIVETGTYVGGSAYYLATVCDLVGRGKIVTVDVDKHDGRPRHRRVTYIHGSSSTTGSSSASAGGLVARGV